MKVGNKLYYLLFFLCALPPIGASAQKEGITLSGQRTGQPPFPVLEYKELPNPKISDASLWQNEKNFSAGLPFLHIVVKFNHL
jgi:hypothetical protein